MKKEIDVWVKIEDGYITTDHDQALDEYGWTKAKLIIEEPEPKVTITPSKLREVIQTVWGDCADGEFGQNEMIKELFGDKK